MNSGNDTPAASRRGRRPGSSGTRKAILNAARQSFAAKGLDRTTVRGVARDAGVDPALITHYFGGKAALFTEAMRLPFTPEEVLPSIIEGDRAQIGRRLAAFALGQWENAASRERLIGIIRAACSDPTAATLLRDLIERDLFAPLARALDVPNAEARAALCASQIVGLAIVRHILRVPALATADPADVAEWIAPTLQRYLIDDMPFTEET